EGSTRPKSGPFAAPFMRPGGFEPPTRGLEVRADDGDVRRHQATLARITDKKRSPDTPNPRRSVAPFRAVWVTSRSRRPEKLAGAGSARVSVHSLAECPERH